MWLGNILLLSVYLIWDNSLSKTVFEEEINLLSYFYDCCLVSVTTFTLKVNKAKVNINIYLYMLN